MDGEEQEARSATEVGISERLGSWKEIAGYLNRDVRTVQRWEKNEGLPVHRRPHRKLGTVYAYKAELDAWWNDGHTRLEEQEARRAKLPAASIPSAVAPDQVVAADPSARRFIRPLIVGLMAVAVAIAVAGFWIAQSQWKAAPPEISSVEEITHDTFWKSTFASDGVRAYYTERAGGRVLLASAPLAELRGLPSLLPIAMEYPRILAASPDGSQLLLTDSQFGEARPVMVMSLASDREYRFAGVTASCAAYSPAGDWVAFCRGNSVFRADPRGMLQKLASFDGRTDSLAWSPSGEAIRVVVEQPGLAGAVAWDTSGILLRQIDLPSRRVSSLRLPLGIHDRCGASVAWTSDGKFFVLGARCTTSSSIWLLPTAHSFLGYGAGWIRLDADFGRITQVSGIPGKPGLLVLNAQSGPGYLGSYDPKLDAWTRLPLGVNPVELDYSRDGRWVTYVEYPLRTLWRSRADGTDPLQLTFPPMRVQLPHWSPDGKTIAFTALTPGNPWKIYLVQADGGGLRAAAPSKRGQGGPSWSADGEALVFGDVETSEPLSHFIHRLILRTGQLTDLPGSGGMRTARWSPNGRYIAAILYSRAELEIFDPASGKWMELAGGVTGDTLNWSADSRFVYFDSPYEPHPGIYRVEVADHQVTPVVMFGSFRTGPDLNLDASGFSITPDGSILMNGSPQSSRVYEVDWGR